MSEPHASLIVPSRNRWPHLLELLRALADQTAVECFEVIVVDDGSDADPPGDLTAGQWPMEVRLLRPGRVGIGPAKNRAIAEARGPLLVFINDDTYPANDFVEQHLAARRDAGDHLYMHLGLTRWRRWPDENLFDALIADSGMIFFYHNLEPRGLYNFRHAWNCNLSVDAAAVREAGGFNERLGPFFFEDLELAFRLEQQGWRVRYWPEAVCEHDHRYTPAGYLDREHLLGRMAVWLWRANPDCFGALYHTKVEPDYVDYCRRFVAELEREAETFARSFRRWHEWPVATLDAAPAGRQAMVGVFVQAHRLLKRCCFRRGLLEELDAQQIDSTE